MADFGPQDYGRIGLSFANWRNMTGMDKNPFPMQQSSPGVAPPTLAQEWDSAKSQMAAIPGAFKQAVSGNFKEAEKMLSPNNPAQTITEPSIQSPVINNDYDYTSGLEMSGLGFDAGSIGDGAEAASMFG